MAEAEASGGTCGCLSFVIFCILVWALVFGLTIGGTHYSMECTSDRGVFIQEKKVDR